MKPIRVRSLTPRGLAELSAYLATGPTTREGPPVGLLTGSEYSKDLPWEVVVRARHFTSKYDMGTEVSTAFDPKVLETALSDNAIWAWLSLALHEATMPKKVDGWFVGAKSRHIVERIPGRSQDQSHRHLVKGAVIAVWRFNSDAKVLMGRPDEQTKIEEQIMSRKANMGLASATEVVRAAHRLYFDEVQDAVKRGAKSTGAGSVMRFIDVLTQLDVNFDIPSLTADTILSLLPRSEFGKFLSGSTSKA